MNNILTLKSVHDMDGKIWLINSVLKLNLIHARKQRRAIKGKSKLFKYAMQNNRTICSDKKSKNGTMTKSVEMINGVETIHKVNVNVV